MSIGIYLFTNSIPRDVYLTLRLIKVLVPALCLIHHLFYGMEVDSQPSLSADLPHILQQAASLPAYNGLDHTFIVTMTRLGYADVPEWLGVERVMLVDDIAGKECCACRIQLLKQGVLTVWFD